jgi:hypothetical protein
LASTSGSGLGALEAMVGVDVIDLLGLALSCKLGGQTGLKLVVTEGHAPESPTTMAIEKQGLLSCIRLTSVEMTRMDDSRNSQYQTFDRRTVFPNS